MSTTTVSSVLFDPGHEEDRFLPEGPREVVVGGRLALSWVNIQSSEDAKTGSVNLRFWDNGEHRKIPVPGRPGFCLPSNEENLVLVGATKSLAWLDLVTRKWEQLCGIPDDNPRTIINDAEIIPGGRGVIFGTKDTEVTDSIAHIYMYEVAERRLTTLAPGQVCSNGKAIYPASANTYALYDIDTPRKSVAHYILHCSERLLGNRWIAVDLSQESGFPDGMCSVGDGSVVIAFYNPEPQAYGRIGRYRLDSGELVEEWQLPGSPRVTCPLLVQRSDGVKLIATTATEGMPNDQRSQCPNAGSLFMATTGVPTLPSRDAILYRS